jgi:uncharacterized protein YybS (DUF2232 family)
MAVSLFCPAPLALLGARENNLWMTLGLAGISAVLLILDPVLWVSFFLGQGLLCYGLTLPLGRTEKGAENLFFCAAVSIFSKVLFLALVVALTGRNPYTPDAEALKNLYARFGAGSGGEDASLFAESLGQMIQFIPYMTPSLIVLSSMFDSFANYKVCEFLQRGRARAFPPLPPFEGWRFPKSLLGAFFFAFVLPLLVDTESWPLGTMLEFNLKFLVNVFFFLQGLSLIEWGLSKRGVRRAARLPVTLLFFLPILGVWAIALGVGDMCLDLRPRFQDKIEKKR